MKTKYQTPEIKVLTLYAEDVIRTSSTSKPGMSTETVYPSGGSNNGTDWGDLWN